MTRINPNLRKPPKHEPKVPPAKKPRRPLNRVSDKRKQVKADTDQPRKDFVTAVGCCMVEGCPNPPMGSTHEITSGNGRKAALYQPRMQMAVCPAHHHEFHNQVWWTKKRQLAERVRWELRQFCTEFCAGLGNAPSYFTVDELIDYLMFGNDEPLKKRKVKG